MSLFDNIDFLSFEDVANDKEIYDDADKILKSDDVKQLKERGKKYSRLLELYLKYYNKKITQNTALKCCFFWIFVSFFVIIGLTPILIIILASLNLLSNTAIIASVIGAAGSIITSIIVIPRIIASYLFSVDEDKAITRLITNMQKEDSATRQMHHNNKD